MSTPITQCPHCKTRFRIQQAQMDARRGLVCCGRCQHVFNARSNLIDSDSVAPLVGEPEAEVVPAEQAGVTDSVSAESERPEPVALEAESPTPLPPTALPQVIEPLVPETQQTTDLAPIEVESAPAAQVAAQFPPSQFLEAPERDKQVWFIVGAVLLMALLLIGQLVFAFRVELAARIPVLSPLLHGYCQVLKCEIPLPRQAELLSLESSGLEASPEGEKWIVLTAVVRNRAPYVQACPELLLTLTDQHDATLIRKTFRPEEYLPAAQRSNARLESGEDMDIRLELEVSDIKPVGYRLLLYYPDLP